MAIPVANAPAPALNLERLRDLGERLRGTFTKYKSDRLVKETAWLKHLRQFKGIYGEDVIIAEGRSQAYPRLTRSKCVTAKARLMNMLFPAGEKNWAVKCPAVPTLDSTALQGILAQLQTLGMPLTQELIDKAITKFATERAVRMEQVIDSQLADTHYEEIVRQVVQSAILYGTGVMKGPFVTTATQSTIQQDPQTQQWQVVPTLTYKPPLEFVQIWDFFPDLSANDWESTDGAFFRHVMTRHDFAALAKRPDFIAANIQTWLTDNAKGNYDPAFYRTYMKALGFSTIPSGTEDKIEAMEYWGHVSGHTLQEVGIDLPDGTAGDVSVNIWMVDNVVIKAVLNPYEAQIKPWHVFVYEQDDTSILGSGIPEILEDSQRGLCAATRMLLDNASVTTGPIFEMNVDLLTSAGDADALEIRPFKVFSRESGTDASIPAIRQVPVVNHVPDLLNIINQMRETATEETAISSSAVGDSEPSQESLRTSSGISMLMGNSTIQIRDTVKNFDRFTRSVIRSLIAWNNQFNDRADIKGEHEPVARASTSLVAREVRMTALDQLAAQLQPQDAIYIDRRALLEERFKLHDLPLHQILKSKDEVAQAQAKAESEMADQHALDRQKATADIQEALSMAFMNVAKGDAAANAAQAQFYESVLSMIGTQNAQSASASPPGSPSPAPAPQGGPSLPAGPGLPSPASAPGGGPPLGYGGPGPGGAIAPTSAGLPGFAQGAGPGAAP